MLNGLQVFKDFYKLKILAGWVQLMNIDHTAAYDSKVPDKMGMSVSTNCKHPELDTSSSNKY